MQVIPVNVGLRKAIGTSSYVKYPSLDLKCRDYQLVRRINEEHAKGIIEMLARNCSLKLMDISGEHMKFRLKDKWLPIVGLHTTYKLFIIAYMATVLQKPVVFRYGFDQMKAKTLRNFFTTFKDSEYVILLCDDVNLRKLTPLLSDNKILATLTQDENEEVYIRKPIAEVLPELDPPTYIDNIRDYDMFKTHKFVKERFPVVKRVLWADSVTQVDNYLSISKAINEPSYELRQLLELCCRDCQVLVLNEPDVYLNNVEKEVFYKFLAGARHTYSEVYLSEYR